jgi:hypothetical protein
MPDYVLVNKGVILDPQKMKRTAKKIYDKVLEEIAEAIRLELAEFLRALRQRQSKRLTQLREKGVTLGLARNNPFSGVQARKRLRGGKWIIYVTRGSKDDGARIPQGLFNLLDKGHDGFSTEQPVTFPLWIGTYGQLSTNRLDYGSLEAGAPVKLALKKQKSRRSKKVREVPVMIRTKNVQGFEGYRFYNAAVLRAKRKKVGTVVSLDGLEYKITENDFKSKIDIREVEVQGEA